MIVINIIKRSESGKAKFYLRIDTFTEGSIEIETDADNLQQAGVRAHKVKKGFRAATMEDITVSGNVIYGDGEAEAMGDPCGDDHCGREDDFCRHHEGYNDGF